MKKLNKLFLALLVSSAFFASCSSDDDTTDPVQEPRGNYDGGLFIANEGNFEKGNGSISYLSEDLKIENNVFSLVNTGKKIGDAPQSIGFNGNFAYIVVNGSNKIEVVNRYTFKSIATVTADLSNPRYIAFANGKGYVTNWGDGASATDDYVAIFDLTANKITSKIPVVEGPEKIIENNGSLYVAHKGGFSQGNSLTVISSATNKVTTNFVVGDVPSSLVKDNGTLYVLCNGRPSYAAPETAGKLVKVNLSTNTVASTIDFSAKTHPGFLDIENNKLYYTVGKDIYSAATSTTTLPAAATFKATKVTTLYGFAVKNSKIYVADAINFLDNGDIYTYTLTGTETNVFKVEVTPNGFYFNN
ncbi:hypothetical protein SGQ83_11060 [Flavobacterium sp. Fl-318]|uniref:YncE family protein n=1 Tax=Flavobacterium cupriresistens TaxID=2893885 RepID=A0ABU4RBE0_9FLAO|nr:MULTISPECIES: DUF5074 domain-containing protein [unclassified Flavobacterium]MDX6189889.1 hypothetical protein [Flavobacterium sp. Fl-318]UFH42714.1 hypothetical protein LNP23_00510 [Flavobacterium sp. F-323]